MFRRFKDKEAGTTKKQHLIPSVISEDMHVLGNIVSPEGALDIAGQIEGNVRAHTISIREEGNVRGDVTAEIIYVHGKVEGVIKARNVTLYANAHVIGTIMHEALSVEDGAFIDGKFKRTDRLSDEEMLLKRAGELSDSARPGDEGVPDEPASEAELIVLENLRLIR